MFGAEGRIHDDHFKLVVPAPVTQRTDVRIDQVNVVNFEICTENKFSQSGALKLQPTCNILLELLQSVGVYIEARDGAGPEHDATDGEHPAPAPEVRHKPVLDVVEGGGDGVQHAGGNVRPGGVLLCERKGNISFINDRANFTSPSKIFGFSNPSICCKYCSSCFNFMGPMFTSEVWVADEG